MWEDITLLSYSTLIERVRSYKDTYKSLSINELSAPSGKALTYMIKAINNELKLRDRLVVEENN